LEEELKQKLKIKEIYKLMSEINRYISFIKSQSVMELTKEEIEEYLDFKKDNEVIEQYINKMKTVEMPLELENSILENNMRIDWLGNFIELIIKNDLKEILHNKKILDYIKNINGRNFKNHLPTIK